MSDGINNSISTVKHGNHIAKYQNSSNFVEMHAEFRVVFLNYICENCKLRQRFHKLCVSRKFPH